MNLTVSRREIGTRGRRVGAVALGLTMGLGALGRLAWGQDGPPERTAEREMALKAMTATTAAARRGSTTPSMDEGIELGRAIGEMARSPEATRLYLLGTAHTPELVPSAMISAAQNAVLIEQNARIIELLEKQAGTGGKTAPKK